MGSNILELKQLTKSYKDHTAVKAVDLSIPKQSIFGLLGPNGAGKTSMIRMITSITKPDTGQILLDGEELTTKHVRAIGYLPEERGLYKKMKVYDQLLYLAQLKGLTKSEAKANIQYWGDRFQINSWWSKSVEELSKGMQQKVQFVATVLHDPKLIILDEPFTGLDPINTDLIKDEIFNLNKNGASIIFSTHRMEQVEEICEHIALINQGEVILNGPLKKIKNDFKENIYRIEWEGDAYPDFASSYQVIKQKSNSIHVKLQNGQADILKSLSQFKGRVTVFEEILPSLNEIFIASVHQNKALHE